MSTGKSLFILALIFRHRLRYAIERFIYTGKIDEGVSKTLQSNIQSLTQSDKVVALPRVSSEAAMVHLMRQQQTPKETSSHNASHVVFQPPSPSLSTMGAYSDVAPLDLNATSAHVDLAASGTEKQSTESALGQVPLPRRDWPFALPTNKLGVRMCGCAEINLCSHKDAQGKPLPSYEIAYASWRSKLDRRCLFAVVVWLSARRFLRSDQTFQRRVAAVAVQLSCSLMPQLVVLYKLTSHVDGTSSLPLKLLLRVLACYSITYFASHQTVSLPHAMVQASRQFKFPAIPPLIEAAQEVDESSVSTPMANGGPHSTALSLSQPQPTRVPTVMDILNSVLKDTPRVTMRVLRFYCILFLVIRPLARMKNPFRKNTQVLRDIGGAVLTLTIARFGFATASLWRTTDKGKVWMIQLARFATVVAAVLAEYGVLSVTLPQNAGTALLHAFVAASGLTSAGAFLIGYDRFRRLCCALDACAGESGISGSLLGLT